MAESANTSESSEPDLESSDSEYNDIPDLYLETEWDSGRSFQARTPAFEKAVNNLKIILKKGVKELQVGDIKLKVLDVTKQGGGTLTNIEITDKEGIGQVKVHNWGPKKKTRRMTVQVSKSCKGEFRHVEVLAVKVVKPLLDKLLNGESVKSLIK